MAGEFRGRKLASPPDAVRPTQDRVRQILFDILGASVQEGAFLDLYAGSGAIGFEAMSRGATALVQVELSRAARLVLERNRAALGLEAELLATAVVDALPRLLAARRSYRWVAADPPYGGREAWMVLSWFSGEGLSLLDDPGGLILETARDEALPEAVGALERTRRRDVGGSALHFYARKREGT
ncbi:MAG: 16S rRNA (guanine(966)-N(2))-methyltransferase RsmD [Candidatus Eisenbacteria bacterium]